MNIGDGATNVIAVNTVFDSNRRQGVSVKKVSGLHFKNSIFSNTAGQNPQAGVDIEGNSPGDSSGDITFQQSKFLNNAGAGLMIDQHGSNLNGLLVEECEFTGTRGIEVKGRKDGVAAVFTQIMIRNSTIKGNSILGGSGRMGGGGKHVNTTMDGNIAGGRILITKAAAGSSFRITNNNLPNGDASIVLRDNEPDITVTRTGNRQD